MALDVRPPSNCVQLYGLLCGRAIHKTYSRTLKPKEEKYLSVINKVELLPSGLAGGRDVIAVVALVPPRSHKSVQVPVNADSQSLGSSS